MLFNRIDFIIKFWFKLFSYVFYHNYSMFLLKFKISQQVIGFGLQRTFKFNLICNEHLYCRYSFQLWKGNRWHVIHICRFEHDFLENWLNICVVFHFLSKRISTETVSSSHTNNEIRKWFLCATLFISALSYLHHCYYFIEQ